MSGRLVGKVAIITGASTGLGPVMAKRFVDEGERVLLAARREELVPLRDVSSTDDVANLALYLASDEARTITGQSVVVDAGSYMLG